jgi:error-prone DNA polymerase
MYMSLHTHSYYSLLRGASSPEALIEQAARFSMPAMALTDNDALYGAVAFSQAAAAAGIKPIFGCELTLTNGGQLTLLAETQQGYRNLCRIITHARRGQEKGTAAFPWQELTKYRLGLIALSGSRHGEIGRLLLDYQVERAVTVAERYASIFGRDNFFLEVQRHHELGDLSVSEGLQQIAKYTRLRLVATSDVRYVAREQADVLDILTCIRHQLPMAKAEPYLLPNDEFYLLPPDEMLRRFVDLPDAIEATREIADRCHAKLPTGPQTFPVPKLPGGYDGFEFLCTLCQAALYKKIDWHNRHAYTGLLERELKLIKQQGLTAYFLIVWDVVAYARERGILCQGRGSAANSLVSYLLDITPVDPLTCGLVFERFLSPERVSPPDIDIDFASNRREEVIQYLYTKYGHDYIAMAATMSTFGARQALRDVGKALGFSEAKLDDIIKKTDFHSASELPHSGRLRQAFGKEIDSPLWQQLFTYTAALDSYPRHLGIHVGGMVLATGPALIEQIPIEPATMEDRFVVQYDKYALEDAGYVKIDILSLRTPAALEDALMFIEQRTGQRPDLSKLTFDDPRVYAMIRRGDTMGVFQVESRAQSNLIPEFKTKTFADITIQIALIRPGPVQANMVHPFLDRRSGKQPVTYLHPLLEPALKETLGVILFQEQVLKVAHDVAGFTNGEGELLRRALGHKRAGEQIETFHDKFIAGALANGVPEPVAEKIFGQLRAFGGYSFSKAHAAAFAVITYWSAWLRCYYPSEFIAGVLRYQPMGFYDARTVVADTERRGIKVIPLDARISPPQTIAKDKVIYLGLDYAHGWGKDETEALTIERMRRPFSSVADLVKRTKLSRRDVESLVLAGGLDYLGERRDILWDLAAAYHAASRPAKPMNLPRGAGEVPALAPMTAREKMTLEFAYTGVTVGQHLTSAKGDVFAQEGAQTVKEVLKARHNQPVKLGGMIVIRQSPPSAEGVCFLAVEDASGMMNVTVEVETYDKYRDEIRGFVVIEGVLRRPPGKGVFLLARSIKSV